MEWDLLLNQISLFSGVKNALDPGYRSATLLHISGKLSDECLPTVAGGFYFWTTTEEGRKICCLTLFEDTNSQYWKLLYFRTGTEKNLSRLTKKYSMYFHPKKLSLSSQKYGLGFRNPVNGKTYPGSRDQKSTGSRIQIRNTATNQWQSKWW